MVIVLILYYPPIELLHIQLFPHVFKVKTLTLRSAYLFEISTIDFKVNFALLITNVMKLEFRDLKVFIFQVDKGRVIVFFYEFLYLVGEERTIDVAFYLFKFPKAAICLSTASS